MPGTGACHCLRGRHIGMKWGCYAFGGYCSVCTTDLQKWLGTTREIKRDGSKEVPDMARIHKWWLYTKKSKAQECSFELSCFWRSGTYQKTDLKKIAAWFLMSPGSRNLLLYWVNKKEYQRHTSVYQQFNRNNPWALIFFFFVICSG